MTADQQRVLFDNRARVMGDAGPHIKQGHIANCAKADRAYGRSVAERLGLSDARDLLAPICVWFTEGFDMPILQDAKSLLHQIA